MASTSGKVLGGEVMTGRSLLFAGCEAGCEGGATRTAEPRPEGGRSSAAALIVTEIVRARNLLARTRNFAGVCFPGRSCLADAQVGLFSPPAVPPPVR